MSQFRAVRALNFAHGEVIPRGEQGPEVPPDEMTHHEAIGLERYEARVRAERPSARVVAVRLLGRVRFLLLGEDVSIVQPGGSVVRTARRKSADAPDRGSDP